MYVTFKGAHTYQLRAYIYQARDMYGSDRSGLSGLYAGFKNMDSLTLKCRSIYIHTYVHTVQVIKKLTATVRTTDR